MIVDDLYELAHRLYTARVRDEEIALFEGIWQMSLVGNWTLHDLLHEGSNPAELPHDLRLRLARALDATSSFDEGDSGEVDAIVAGDSVVSPAAVLAHKCVASRVAVACLTPPCSGRVGPLAVAVAGVTLAVHYVTDEKSHVDFFRDAIVVENADENAFAALAPHAFPDLAYADDLWRGLRDFSQSFRARRSDLVDTLGALSDHGRRIFKLPQTIWIAEFGSVGIDISPESSNDMRGRCLTHRQRLCGHELVTFEWHIKLDRHVDRVHVHHGHGHGDARPIVGIFTRHLPLSSRGEC